MDVNFRTFSRSVNIFIDATKNIIFFQRKSKYQENFDKPRYYYLGRSFGLGSLWSLLPCGVLHSAFLIASLVNGPLEGAIVMLSFGVASSFALLSGGWLWGHLMKEPLSSSHSTLRGDSSQGAALIAAVVPSSWAHGTLSYRLAGLAVAVAGAWSMYRLLFSMADSGAQCG
ncbi:sulfite exporter TauE/SafE family protein [Leptothrix ochracea]|uniref:sulfite exporter TauE/SafE family protein n=1 Tax=Leptothrix ochracea TaxID=735331 RepID=UPI00155A119D